MVNISRLFKNDEKETSGRVLPLLPVRDIVVFPQMVAPLFVGRPKSVAALSAAMNTETKQLFLSTQRSANVDNPTEKDISKIGVIGTVLQLLRLPDGTVKALVEGQERAQVRRFIRNEEYFQVEVDPMPEVVASDSESEALIRSVKEQFGSYAKLNKNIPKDLVAKVESVADPVKLCDMVASHFAFKIENKQRLLETSPVDRRLKLLVELIIAEMEVFRMDQRIKGRVKEQMEKTQKNYYLNEQIRAIRKEMGAEDESADELQELEKRIQRKRMPKEAANKVRQEFKKLKLMTPMSAEATVVRNYIEWIISLPWFERSRVSINITEAEKILNEDHYGLEKPKERILEYLAVQALVKKIRGPILCLVGPPGVGKTSLAKSVARATGRRFVRLSLGGVRDEAEIRGHRRTYIGALPGKIIQSIKKAGTSNPVFCLDEVDKMSMDFRGDPSAALLEVLDPEQNYAFNDHYLDLDYDLSEILFITTANTLPDIPLPLQDRMEIIRLPGYTEHEKYNIAKTFLVPKQTKLNGLTPEQISISEKAVYTVINRYTRESGVRNLERELASICRKVARHVVK
ncbi:MAG: endopeptidase La, partial [Desulfobacteraceae bacterium]|nr:endopeptidase La [Desulfobacteraceae bacterium]